MATSTAPSKNRPNKTTTKQTGNGTKTKPGNTKTKGGGGSSSSGGGGGYDYAKEQKKAQKKSSNRYLTQARTIQGQIDALRHALNIDMKKGLARQLANIQTQLGQADAQALQGYQEGSAKLLKDASSNEAAAADSSAQALVNRGRERVNAMSQAAL